MKIIISPAKKMVSECAYTVAMSTPVFLKESKQLHKELKQMDYSTLKQLLGCNDKIAQLNYERYQSMNVNEQLNPALLSYDGIQYKYMAPHIFEEEYMTYVKERVRILSGLYGVLKPMDGVVSYRLEMQAKLKIENDSHLYAFWKDKLYQEISKDNEEILNLASDEYSKCIRKYIGEKDRFVTCIFGELIAGKVKEKGVYVKMARGEMVRYMAENNIQKIEEIKQFDRLGFVYQEAYSNEQTYVFVQEKEKTC